MMEARDRPEEAPVGSGRGEKRDRDRADEMTAESDEQRDRERLEGRPAERDEERDREGGPGTRGDGAGPGDGRSDKICFKCKQPGHVASRCPLGKHNAGPQDYWGTVFRVLCIKAPGSDVVRASVAGVLDTVRVPPGIWALTDDTLQEVMDAAMKGSQRRRVHVILLTSHHICASGHIFYPDRSIFAVGCLPVDIWPDQTQVRATMFVNYRHAGHLPIDRFPDLADRLKQAGNRPFTITKEMAQEVASALEAQEGVLSRPPPVIPDAFRPYAAENVFSLLEHGLTHGARGRWRKRQDLAWSRSESRALKDRARGSPELDEDWPKLDILRMSYAQYCRLHKRIRKERKKEEEERREGDGDQEKLQKMLKMLAAGLAQQS